MKKILPLILLAPLLSVACVEFQTAEERIPAHLDKHFNCGLPSFQPEFVNFYMDDWPDARAKIEEELSAVPGLLSASSGKGDLRLRITIEAFPRGKHHADFMEGDPFAFTGRRLSQLAFRWSFGIIPIYEPRERKFTFEVLDGNHPKRVYEYISHNHVLVGLPAIFVAPFVDSEGVVEEAEKVTAYFLEDACYHPALALVR
ncbi:MAG: hypothetical protein KDK25_11660 [Leptospiraceae bacterium]|nr:hypothetical protein [Leptospiraceae bacterium]